MIAVEDVLCEVGQNQVDCAGADFTADDVAGFRINFQRDGGATGAGGFMTVFPHEAALAEFYDEAGDRCAVESGKLCQITPAEGAVLLDVLEYDREITLPKITLTTRPECILLPHACVPLMYGLQ